MKIRASKHIIRTLACYMILLSFIPCSDGQSNCTVQNSTMEYLDESPQNNHSRNCGDDHCSPFCVCSCCSISI